VREFEYGHLDTPEEYIMSEMMKTVGKSEVRKDGRDKVTGTALYAADIREQDANSGALVRSPHHAARIVSMNVDAAKAMPGVLAVVTGHDVPGTNLHGSLIPDQPALAVDVVRHLGEPVVLVVAQTRAAADQACAAVVVEYEPLEAVFDPELALEPGAPKIHPNGNLVTRYDIEDGSVSDGFDAADEIVEEVFFSPRVAPGYMEPENSLAYWEGDMLVVWVSSQHPFVDQVVISETLNMPAEKIRIKSAVIGGAFGGKEDAQIPVLTALGAWATNGPVRIVNNRNESFQAHPKRHPAKLYFKIGARSDGMLTALDVKAVVDTGAFASYGPAVAGILTEMVQGAYHFPNLHVETLVAYTNSPLSGAMRGFGSPQSHFALESIMDMLAERLGTDPVELRRKNIHQPEGKMFTQAVLNDMALPLPQILDHAEKAIESMRQKIAAPGCAAGVGMSMAVQSMGLGAGVPDDSTSRLAWQPDGSVLVYLGAPDLGQGLAAVAEQMTAEVLGLPYEKVRSVVTDTRISPNGNVTCASRMTYMVGKGVIAAAEALVAELLDRAAALLNLPRKDLTYANGMILKPDGQRVPVAEFTSRLADEDVMLSEEATVSFPYPKETTPTHLPIGMPHVMFCFGANVVRVEVDPELGLVTVTDLVAIHDVGRIINRKGVEGQIEGGVAMGLGYALYEEMSLKEDQKWVDGFTEYLMPTVSDMPIHYENIVLEVPLESGPFGAKGIGEASSVPTAPAIANAIADALGVRLTTAPMTPERVRAALDKQSTLSDI
jgi:nicotinate dehydrogenase large molybdopterin subunit